MAMSRGKRWGLAGSSAAAVALGGFALNQAEGPWWAQVLALTAAMACFGLVPYLDRKSSAATTSHVGVASPAVSPTRLEIELVSSGRPVVADPRPEVVKAAALVVGDIPREPT